MNLPLLSLCSDIFFLTKVDSVNLCLNVKHLSIVPLVLAPYLVPGILAKALHPTLQYSYKRNLNLAMLKNYLICTSRAPYNKTPIQTNNNQ